MGTHYQESKTFSKSDLLANALIRGEYEDCTFVEGDFSGFDFSGFSFSDCTFKSCNLSLARLGNTALKEVTFKECRLMGLHFDHCSTLLFSVVFDHCNLNLSSFYQLNLRRCRLKECSLQEADFAGADLSGIALDGCDLHGATFENCNLEKTDFRNALNFSIDPEVNRMKKARFSMTGLPGLLGKYGLEIE